jgi:hypothetical protein
MNFPKISLNHKGNTITIVPMNAEWVINSTGVKKHIVVNYNMTYKLNNIILKNANISYYLSNGYTNNLRANMLLPFYSHNLLTNNSCPIAPIKINGLLFKINLVENINTTDISTYILNKLKFKISMHERDETKIISDMIERSKDLSGNITIDLLSVLPRVKNLLDYLIATNSEMLTNPDIPHTHFKPIAGEDMYDPTKLNDTNKYPSGKQIWGVDNDYREILIEVIRYQMRSLKELGLLNVEFINLPLSEISREEFNNKIHLCKDGNLNADKILNYDQYKSISKTLGEMFKYQLGELIPTIEDEILKKFGENFYKIIIPTNYYTVNQNMKVWDASCKKKYLKYKSKYLNLKKTQEK